MRLSPKIKNGIALSIIPQFILVKWFAKHPEFVEKYYSEGIYPIIAKFLRLLTGWIPFSIGDVLYGLAIILSIRYLIVHWRQLKKHPFRFLRDLSCTLAIVYFIFHLHWGYNYYRLPLHEKMGFEDTYTIEELKVYTLKVAQKTNELQLAIEKDSSSAVSYNFEINDIYLKTLDSYKKATKGISSI